MNVRSAILTVVLLAFLHGASVYATEIALEPTRIPEGKFSILLYKPKRTELPLRERESGITVVTYSYQSYFSAFDVSYVAGFTDWTASKQYETKKYGSPLMPTSFDLDTSIKGVKVMTEQSLRVPVRLLSSHEMTYESYPGRDAEFEFSASGTRYIIRFRTYMIGYKEYWHQVVYPSQYEHYVRPQAFLNSFKLLPSVPR